MNLRLIDKYMELCKIYNKPITWSGLRYFNKAFK